MVISNITINFIGCLIIIAATSPLSFIFKWNSRIVSAFFKHISIIWNAKEVCYEYIFYIRKVTKSRKHFYPWLSQFKNTLFSFSFAQKRLQIHPSKKVEACAGFLNNLYGRGGARNRIGIGLSYRPAKLNRLAELIPWNRFLGSLKVKKFELVCFLPNIPVNPYSSILLLCKEREVAGSSLWLDSRGVRWSRAVGQRSPTLDTCSINQQNLH